MINLKPSEFRMGNYRKIALQVVGIVFGIALIVFCFLNVYKSLYTSRVLANYKIQKATYDEMGKSYEVQDKKLKKLKEEINSKKVGPSLNQEAGTDVGLQISTIMYDLAKETPIDMVFYHQEASANSLKLLGYAGKQQSIGAYLIALQSKKWVSKVNISSSQEMIRDNGFVYIAFEVTITLKKPA